MQTEYLYNSTCCCEYQTDTQRVLATNSATAYLVFYQTRQRKVVEQIREVFPDVCVPILPQALIIETVPAAATSDTFLSVATGGSHDAIQQSSRFTYTCVICLLS